MSRSFLTLCLACLVSVSLVALGDQPQQRTVYVSVLDKNGAPVRNLGAADLVVSENGRPQSPVTVEVARQPLKLALVLDEGVSWSVPLRTAAKSVVLSLKGKGEIGLYSTARGDWQVVDFTTDTDRLVEALGALVPGSMMNSNLNGVLDDVARRFMKERAERPIIVVLSLGCRATGAGCASAGGRAPFSSAHSDEIERIFQRTGVKVYEARADFKPGDDIVTAIETSGGRIEMVLHDNGLPEAADRILSDILGQYAITYTAAAPPSDGASLSVRVNQPKVTVHAPKRVF